jgi:hypothetical protein
MPPWAWVLVVVAALLLVMWTVDRRARARGAQLNDPDAIARGVTGPHANPEAHRQAMHRYQDPGASGF